MPTQPLGELRKEPDGYLVTFERNFMQGPDAVWDMLTNPVKLKSWFAETIIDLAPGGKINFHFNDKDQTESTAVITRIIPGKFFEYLWDEELATWELFAGETPFLCRLVLTYSGMQDDFAITVATGWHIYLHQLRVLLEGKRETDSYSGPDSEIEKLIKKNYQDLWNNTFS